MKAKRLRSQAISFQPSFSSLSFAQLEQVTVYLPNCSVVYRLGTGQDLELSEVFCHKPRDTKSVLSDRSSARLLITYFLAKGCLVGLHLSLSSQIRSIPLGNALCFHELLACQFRDIQWLHWTKDTLTVIGCACGDHVEEEEGEGQCGEAKGPQGRRHQFFSRDLWPHLLIYRILSVRQRQPRQPQPRCLWSYQGPCIHGPVGLWPWWWTWPMYCQSAQSLGQWCRVDWRLVWWQRAWLCKADFPSNFMERRLKKDPSGWCRGKSPSLVS